MGLYKMQVFIFLGCKMYQLMIKKVMKKTTSIVFRFHIIYMKTGVKVTPVAEQKGLYYKVFSQNIVSDWNLYDEAE